MLESPRAHFRVSPAYQSVLRELGLDAETVFTHPQIKVWRRLEDRENATLDAKLADGRTLRLHVKRYFPPKGFWAANPADLEAQGLRALMGGHIPTAPLVGWGRLPDGRSFLITEDLAGYQALDKLIESGLDFDRVRDSVADLAARLHRAGLHHRDLYLCHFFARSAGEDLDLKLIDAARVRPLPRWPFCSRWIVKDMAQLWYSTLALPISDQQRHALIARYTIQRGLPSPIPLARSIARKIRRMARHDARLRHKQPGRNISIPT